MTSTLFSTSCYINTKLYHFHICIDNDLNKYSLSTIDDILSIIDTDQTTSNANHILNSIRFHFEPSNDEREHSNKKNDQLIPEVILLNKILNIKQVEKESNGSKSSSVKESEFNGQINLNYVEVSGTFLWTMERLQLEMDSIAAEKICLLTMKCLSKLKHRPHHLLVFVNPQCGKSESHSIYEEKVLPLFEEANINVNTIHTERAKHAQEYVYEQSLDNYDGLISVGGDGMFSEICHSLLLKTMEQVGLDINDRNIQLKRPNLRIGVIPAGSTDAVAYGTTGYNDPVTSALQIILGESLLIDIATVHSEREFVRFMATMLAYGFFGNIIQQSDEWRIFGPLRYTLSGVIQFIRNTSYHTELTITEASQKSNNSTTSIENFHSHSLDNSVKRRDKFDENSKTNNRNDTDTSSLSSTIRREDYYKIINCLNMPGRCDKSKYGMSPSVHLSDGSFDLILVKRSMSLNFLRFLHQAARDGRDIEELSNVERYRATEVIIHPMVNRNQEKGNWACDGELITANEIRVRAHHQVLNLFASGIRLDQIKKINEEESKLISTSTTKKSHLFLVLSSWQSILLLFLMQFLFFLWFYFF